MPNPFILKAKRKLYEDITEGEMIEVTFRLFFAGLGEPGYHVLKRQGAFSHDDGFNVVLIPPDVKSKGTYNVSITSIQSVRRVG